MLVGEEAAAFRKFIKENDVLKARVAELEKQCDNLADVSIGFLDVVRWVKDGCHENWRERMVTDATKLIGDYMGQKYFQNKRTIAAERDALAANLAEVENKLGEAKLEAETESANTDNITDALYKANGEINDLRVKLAEVEKVVEHLKRQIGNDEELWRILGEHATKAGYKNNDNAFSAGASAILGMSKRIEVFEYALDNIIRLLRDADEIGALSIAKRVRDKEWR
jgi:hypothetical protein